MEYATPSTVLRAGQSLRIVTGSGAMLLNLKGTVLLVTASDWTGDQFMRQRVVLHEGDQYQAERSGAIEVFATTDAEFLAIPAAARKLSFVASSLINLAKKYGQWLRSVIARVAT
ncbi:MAG: hypothetical protein H7315_15250 [Herminiimonas sp.]|nr:hypothetical protein [Herminiimonas sp.]